ncbi:MAG: hypothetical protein ACI9ND_003434 [Yoonia sp.]|jgi:hypothetical protein
MEGSYNYLTSVVALLGSDIAFERVRSRDSILEIVAKSYDYLRVLEAFLTAPPGEGFVSDVAITSLAIYGIATPATDIPAGGNASFNGDGQLSV